METKITLADIAKQAGVSKQTVSRVINNRDDVAYETRVRVQAIIDRLGYRPNAFAQGLSARQSFTIGVISSRLSYFGPQSMLTSIDINAYHAGYRVIPYILHNNHPSEIDNHLRNLIALQPDGIIWEIAGTTENQVPLQDSQFVTSLPIITMNKSLEGIHSVLDVKDFEASIHAVEHLIEQGYTQIGILTGPLNWHVSQQRLNGWKAALAKHGLSATNAQIVEGDWTVQSGTAGISKLLDQYPDLDAVFVCNDQMALGVLSELHQRNIQIPQKVGVVGFDGLNESQFFTPSLTTVHQPFDTYGKELVRMLIGMIEENVRNRAYSIPETITITPELIVRDSSRKQ